MNARSVCLRAACLADVADVTQIEQLSFSDPWSANAFVTALDSDFMRFAVIQLETAPTGLPRVVGYAIALVMAEEAEIANIAVSPAERGRGLGGLLLDWMSRELAEADVEHLFLEVRESNASARALYLSRAFRQVGRRKSYYRLPTEDALILRRDFVLA